MILNLNLLTQSTVSKLFFSNIKTFYAVFVYMVISFVCYQPLHAQDTDGDGVLNNLDLDDDNDGILDTNEGCTATVVIGGNRIEDEKGIGSEDEILNNEEDDTNFNKDTDWLNVEFSPTIPAGTLLYIRTRTNSNDTKTILIQESDDNENVTPGLVGLEIVRTTQAVETVSYTTVEATNNIYISMTQRDGGTLYVEYLYYITGGVCSLDTDSDGLNDNVDLDADADNCPDALEGTGGVFNANLVTSSIAGGSTSIQENLGNTVDTNGVPTMVPTGQGLGSSRDASTESDLCLDSDGDLAYDLVDLDDDNDGILDTTEGCTAPVEVAPNANYTISGVTLPNRPTRIYTDNNNGAEFDNSDAYVIEFNNIIPAGTVIYIETESRNDDDVMTILVQESNSAGTVTGGLVGVSITHDNDDREKTTEYITVENTQHFKLATTFDGGGSIEVDYLYYITNGCTQDTDSDGIVDALDLDSDADDCPDALEGAAAILNTSLVTSSLPGGSTSIQDNLGNTVDGNGVPTIASGGQGIGSNIDNLTQDTECPSIDTDGDLISDNIDLDDDNDGILDTIENGSNLLIDGGFDSLSPPLFGNNVGTVSIAPWVRESGGTANVILVDGAGGSTYGAGGPEFDASGGAGNYFDFNGSGVIYQTFTLATNTIVSYGGYFSARDGLTGNGSIAIYSGTGSGGTLMGSSGTITTSDNTDWTFTTNTLALIAGTYSFVVTLDNPINFDQGFVYNVDVDGDGIINALDLDSDGDGCPDAIESATSTALLTSGVSATDGIIDNTDNALVNTTVDPIGANGFANSLEDVDTSGAVSINAYTATNYTTYALDAATNGCGVPVITQVYRNGAERWIELTNISPTNILVPNGANVNLFNGGITTAITNTGANTAALASGSSVLFTSTGTPGLIPNPETTVTVDAGLTNIDNTNDIVSISRSGIASSTIPWDSRVDVITGINETTSYVRSDAITTSNATFTANEWVAFVDDGLSTTGALPQRHPQAPLLSEISGANANSNTVLGLHRFGPTTRTGSAWDNGFPDRTREVIIDEDYFFSTDLKARKLVVDNNSILAPNNSLLVVSDDITLTNANDEIRLRGTSQLVQTHTGTTQITGTGKLLIDQNSPTTSLYLYNYFSSPVNTIGGTTYNLSNVLKDGTAALSFSGVIGSTIAKNISFVTGLDGDTTDPIEIAERWLYTYPSAVESYWSWNKISSTDAIPQTDGFIMKGPGAAQNYTFVGTPKDGELTTNIGADEFYLVGNPFPSALSAERFIRDNIGSITGSLLFWQHTGAEVNSGQFGHYYEGYIGGYAVRNLSMGIAADGATGIGAQGTAGAISGTFLAPEPFIPVGQGFVIIGNGTGGSIVFNNSQRAFIGEGTEGSNTSIFFRNNTKTPHAKNTSNESGKLPIIKLGIDYKNQDDLLLHRQIGISFSSENSFSYEKGYDSEIYQLGFTEIYWKFPNDDKNYVITGVQELTDDMEIPLEITMGADGELTMGIDQIINIDRPTYIKDALLDKTYLINKETKATITLPKGTYTNRFYLVFTNNSKTPSLRLSTEENQELGKDIQVRVDKKTNDILIENNSEAYIEKVTLYNILGQVIKKWDTLEQSEKHRLKVKNTANQVYIITVQTNKGTFSKKLIIPVIK